MSAGSCVRVSSGARTRSRTGSYAAVSALVVVLMSVGMVLLTVDIPLERQGVSSAWSAWLGRRQAFGGTRTRSERAGRSAGTQAWSVLVLVPMVLLVTLLTLTVVLLRAGVESVAVLILMVMVALSRVCRWGEGVEQSIATGRVCWI